MEELKNVPDENKYSTKHLIHTIEKSIKTHYISIDEQFVEPKQYRKVLKLLRECSIEDTVVFDINTEGGDLAAAIQLINEIQLCKAKCIARISNAYSAGSILALSCDEILTMPFATFMIHTVTWSGWNEDEEMPKYFIEKWTRSVLFEIYRNFLTEEEIEDIQLKNREIWLTKDELDARLLAWHPMRDRKILFNL